ncbi:MAG: SPOR domain-containing protein, partial [Pseudomonadota bacterium]
MRLSYLAIIAALTGMGVATEGTAKTLAEAASPVNFPPAEFEGRSFVDNDGCIYIRAGVDGATTWVPRVTRTRQVICGQTPTFGRTQLAAQQAPAPAPEPAVAAPEPVAVPAAPAPQPEPTQQAAVPAPAQPTTTAPPTPRAAQRVAPAPALPAPTVTVSAPQPTTPPAERTVVQTEGSCPDAPASSQPFFNPGARCGPQVQSPSAGTIILAPGQTWEGRTASLPPVPEGYRRAWTDGRLNPLRGIFATRQAPAADTAAPTATTSTQGYDLAWTDAPPYMLFDRRTGIVVGDQFPNLTYPNLTPTGSMSATVSTREVAPVRSAPRVPPDAPASRHIQVATYGDPATARADAQRLANAGLPTRIGTYRRGGAARQVIVLGPFDTTAARESALRQTRGLGFTSA